METRNAVGKTWQNATISDTAALREYAQSEVNGQSKQYELLLFFLFCIWELLAISFHMGMFVSHHTLLCMGMWSVTLF